MSLGLALLTLWQAFAPVVAWAGSGGVVTLPNNATKWKSGLKLEIDTTWIDGDGYRPVRVEATNWPPGPTPADRTFRIMLRPRSWDYGDAPQSVTFYLELPQGAAQARSTVSIPQHSGWSQLEVQVYEDGLRLDDLSGGFGIPSNANSYNWSETLPGILIIDVQAPGNQSARNSFLGQRPTETPARLPDIRQLASRFLLPQYYGGPANRPAISMDAAVSDLETLNLLNSLPNVALLPPSELPVKWLDHTAFDVIFVSWQELRTLVRQHRDQWHAIRSWAETGPTLCVFGVELTPPALAELEEILNIAPTTTSDSHADPQRGWSIPTRQSGSEQSIRGLEEIYTRQAQMMGGVVPGSTAAGKTAEQTSTASPASPSEPEPPYLLHSLGLGHVVACRTPTPFAPSNQNLARLFNDLGVVNWRWYQRHGFSQRRDNSAYWDLSVPGVGAAPIKSYLALITLFAIIIGPVNYVLLHRRRRLYLLLVTVPAGAGLVTVALLAYALVSDGLGVRARIRSFTEIDQRSGQAVAWARQSYYAGLAPSRGLTFPADVACYPIEQFAGDRRSRHRNLLWDDQQHLLSGYLSSRSTAQFMVVQSQPSKLGLQIAAAADQSLPPQVTNRLNTQLLKVFLRDAQGHYYGASDVSPEQVFQPQAVDKEQVIREIKSAWIAERPAFPLGFDSSYYKRGFGRRYYYSNNVDQALPAAQFDIGILERNLRQAAYSELTPCSYVAITGTAPELPLGSRAAREQASYHVVLGRW
jgi:hypothetical protein